MISPKVINEKDGNKEIIRDSFEEKKEEGRETEKKEREKIEKSIEAPIKTINNKIFKLLSNHNDLLYDIKSKIKNISQKENQLFSVCGIIA